jgi:hypothetical protein
MVKKVPLNLGVKPQINPKGMSHLETSIPMRRGVCALLLSFRVPWSRRVKIKVEKGKNYL